jgi:serine/threonine-protein kinase
MTAHPIEPDTSVAGYRLGRVLGRGAMAQVFEATAPDGSVWALKLMLSEHARRPDLVKRFEREIALASSLQHPNLVRVEATGYFGTQPFLVMPLMQDASLADFIADDGALPVDDAIFVVDGVLQALELLHARSIVHREVKAENILVTPDGRPVLSDLGLAFTELDPRITHLSQGPLGTPNYMAPEQWRGGTVDRRTDLFAAGVLLFFLLSGEFPFPAKSAPEALARLLRRGPETLPESVGSAPRRAAIDAFIERALQLKPEDRFSEAATMRAALAQLRHTPMLDEHDLPVIEFVEETNPAVAPLAQGSIMSTSPRLQRPPRLPQPDTPTDPRKLAVLPVEFAPNSHWVGKRPPGEFFYANPYLRTFEGNGKTFNLIIDPGSSSDFSVVQAKSSKIIGDMGKISAVFINHQDPDVGSSAGVLLGRYAPHAFTLCTEDTWRLIHYYNIPRDRFIALEKYPDGFKLPTGHRLVPVPSPFCHFVGAMMLYDPETRVLYSGDLFGGLTDKNARGLWADESDWVGMRAFHQIYMPTNRALRHAIANIRAIDGSVDIIAPQHGRLLRGDILEEFMQRLEDLPVGLDIISDRQASADELVGWVTVLDRILSTADSLTDVDLRELLLEDATLRGLVSLTGSKIQISSMGKFTVERALRIICDALDDPDVAGMLKYEVVHATSELDLPTPVMELDEDGGDSGGGSTSMLGSVM